MKKRWAAILIGLLYVAVLGGLLLLQAKTIEGRVTKFTANVTTVLLVIPIFFLFKAYIKVKAGEEEKVPGARGSTCESSPELVREVFYERAKQLGLSAREQEVAWLIYRGFTNLQIAEEMYISETTVKKHAGHIYEKLEIPGRKALREKMKSVK